MADFQGNPNSLPHVSSSGVLQELTAAQAATKFGAGNIKTPLKNFTLNYKGLHMNCFKNVPIVCDAALIAAFAATSAPVV